MGPWSSLIVLLCTILLLQLVDLNSYASHASIFSNYFPSWSQRKAGSSSTSSPFLKIVDPQKIVSSVRKYSGLILPKKIEGDLRIIEDVCSCDEASLDLYNCVLEVTNFTISIPGDDSPSVRVQRFRMTWDSYTKPCLYIEVDGVDILVEFVNLLLTRNNWNELQDLGFPPSFYEEEEDSKASCDTSSSFVRFGDLKMPGAVDFKVRSKSLNKTLSDIQIPLDKSKELSQMIRHAAKEADDRSGRKGCTTDEMYTIIQSFFARQLQDLLKFAAVDLALHGASESTTLREIKKSISGAKDTIIDYAKDAGDKTINEQLSKFGLDQEQINSLKNAVKSASVFSKESEKNK
eukprot:CAMPEP_0194253804 /NCGR_PEP_ID=MMETSP0158-20130606/30646_1 /TAXON_ID=33649 /ORGANISM="Thalassionema nitzschioides, Strain L26-B" /LENGTH=347 /DNA_ID=CAMNT_0038991617 /DNA_START=44 /DNA_END=1087 /DNA_ORIENTATION=+